MKAKKITYASPEVRALARAIPHLVELASIAGLDERVLTYANATELRAILRELRDQARAALDMVAEPND